jgi:CRP-like cAMP-binding protein
VLSVETIVPEAVCTQCGNKFRFEKGRSECAKCGSVRLALQGGDNISLDSVLIKDKAMDTNVITETLREIQFTRGLAPEYLEKIAAVARIRDYDQGAIVFHEGEAAGKIYLIVSGAVSLKICEGGLGSKQIVTLKSGELLGWSSLTGNPRFLATAEIEGPTRMVEIDGARVRELCRTDSKFGYEFMGRTLCVLSKRLITTWAQLADLYVPAYAPVTFGAAARND